MTMITDYRKKQISELADFLSNDFSINGVTNLQEIADSEELPIHYDHYEDSFDGMLLHDGFRFHIHINIDKGNTLTSKRGRFSLGHEYGHYFIDEHRIGLKYGLLQPHPSFNNLRHETLIELEADYFASCLLMPFSIYKAQSARKAFGFDLMYELSDKFQTSLVATILRSIQAGCHEFIVVVSRKNIIKWFAKSEDFPGFAFRFKVGQTIPINSLSTSFNARSDAPQQSLVTSQDPEDWFWINDYRANNPFFEQYYYSDVNDYLITLLWFQ